MTGFKISNASQGLLLIFAAALPLCTQARAGDDPWASLKTEIFGSQTIIENDGVVSLDSPVRAEDAALVPISMKVTPAAGQAVRSLSLIIDSNPSPVAAKFTFGPAAGDNGAEQLVATRVRVDSYTFVRAIAETSDGTLHMTTKFLKASGGCSAPVPKDIATALKGIGRILIKNVAHTESPNLREVQVMLKHPNFNGMQMDPDTRAYTPAKFIKQMTINYGGGLVLEMESGISISSDPNLRFSYKYNGQKPFTVTATDTDNTTFTVEAEAPGS